MTNPCYNYEVLISCLIDDELTEKEKEELNAHVPKCPSCKKFKNILVNFRKKTLAERTKSRRRANRRRRKK